MRKHRETAGVSPKEATELAAENRRLRAELAESRRANEILRKASTFYQGGTRPQAALIVKFIDIHRHRYLASSIIRALASTNAKIAVSSYYAFKAPKTVSPYHS